MTRLPSPSEAARRPTVLAACAGVYVLDVAYAAARHTGVAGAIVFAHAEYAAALVVCALLLRPLVGVSRNQATAWMWWWAPAVVAVTAAVAGQAASRGVWDVAETLWLAVGEEAAFRVCVPVAAAGAAVRVGLRRPDWWAYAAAVVVFVAQPGHLQQIEGGWGVAGVFAVGAAVRLLAVWHAGGMLAAWSQHVLLNSVTYLCVDAVLPWAAKSAVAVVSTYGLLAATAAAGRRHTRRQPAAQHHAAVHDLPAAAVADVT